MTPLELYESVIREGLTVGPPKRRTVHQYHLDEPGEDLLIAWSGFFPNRWVSFCDDYLGGGPAFELWLQSPRLRPYTFKNDGHHTKGGCITSLVLDGKSLHLTSRASNWVPTGILDLKLLSMAWRRLDARRALWTVEDVNLDPMTVFSYHRFRELGRGSDFAEKAYRVLDTTDAAQLGKHQKGMLGRHKKAVRRGRERVVSDETRIRDAFTFAIPRDFVWASDGDLRESWVTRVTGKRGYGEYQWDHLDYPELAKVVERLGSRPDIRDMAQRRARRG